MKEKLKNKEFAIVDIETTGGNAQYGGITEIAILIHDGEKVIDTYETLINPGRNIPYSITLLTGIDNETVAEAPSFAEVASEIYSYLENRIFVAHNVNFDYSFIKHQLSVEGYSFNPTKLCTVRLSRKLSPGFHSYSLGILCERLDIPIENRHRAMGDAAATTILFSKLLGWDEEGIIQKMLKKHSKEQQLPPHLPKEEFEKLPSKPGVYYFHDQAGKIIYIGKAINIRKRVLSHFTGHNPGAQRQNFLKNIHSISFEECATELMCLLLECSEIKHFWPKYNRALKKYEANFALYEYKDIRGYRRLVAGKLHPSQRGIKKYYREGDAVNALLSFRERYQIDIRLCNFGQQAEFFDPDSNPDLNSKELPDIIEHNDKIEQMIADIDAQAKSFMLIDRGRNMEEVSCIWVEKGEFYGMGYIDRNSDIQTFEEIKSGLTAYKANHYMMDLIDKYAKNFPRKIVPVSEDELEFSFFNQNIN